MKASEIVDLLLDLPEEAVLSHVWTAPVGKPSAEGIQQLKTKLYFKSGKIRMEASLEHAKDLNNTARATKAVQEKPVEKSSPTLGDKFGALFKPKESNAATHTL